MLFQVPQNPIFAGISRVRSEEPADQRSPADGRGQEVQADLLVQRYLHYFNSSWLALSGLNKIYYIPLRLI